jgi:hypothetical protein
MTHQAMSRIWPHVPVAQRRWLIAQLSQMATRYLQTIRQAEEALDEHNNTCRCLGEHQDSGSAPRSVVYLPRAGNSCLLKTG